MLSHPLRIYRSANDWAAAGSLRGDEQLCKPGSEDESLAGADIRRDGRSRRGSPATGGGHITPPFHSRVALGVTEPPQLSAYNSVLSDERSRC